MGDIFKNVGKQATNKQAVLQTLGEVAQAQGVDTLKREGIPAMVDMEKRLQEKNLQKLGEQEKKELEEKVKKFKAQEKIIKKKMDEVVEDFAKDSKRTVSTGPYIDCVWVYKISSDFPDIYEAAAHRAKLEKIAGRIDEEYAKLSTTSTTSNDIDGLELKFEKRKKFNGKTGGNDVFKMGVSKVDYEKTYTMPEKAAKPAA